MSEKRIGVRQIASLAGVSPATVSRVINNPDHTSPEICERVNKIIKEYNYVPNQMAKNLFSKTSNSIAVFMYDMKNPFFIRLVQELNKIAFANKYTLLICDTENNYEKEKEYLNYCERIRTSGIIITEGCNTELFINSRNSQPLVFLDRMVDEKFSTVRSDNDAGIKMLIDYLYNLNHRKIGFAGFCESCSSISERKNAFLEGMEAKDLEVPPEYIFNGDLDPNTGVTAMDYFYSLNNRPTAIMCSTDQIAKGMVMRANKLGVSIPNDFSVVAFDGTISDYFWPKITTIAQNITKIAQLLFDCIFLPEGMPIQHTVDISMIIGDSCKKI
jgi:DNA-binding LacI/PurR family transcriptional regulator